MYTNISSIIRSPKNNVIILLSANEQNSFSCWKADESGLIKISDDCFSAIPEDSGLSVAYTVPKDGKYIIQTTEGKSYGPFEEVFGLYRYTDKKGLVYIVKENARYTLYVDKTQLTVFYPSGYPIYCTIDPKFDNIRILYVDVLSGNHATYGLTEKIFGLNPRTYIITYSSILSVAGIFNPIIDNYEDDTIAIENFDAGTGYCIINKGETIFSTIEKFLAKALLDNASERLSIVKNFLNLGDLTLPAPKNTNSQMESYGLLKAY